MPKVCKPLFWVNFVIQPPQYCGQVNLAHGGRIIEVPLHFSVSTSDGNFVSDISYQMGISYGDFGTRRTKFFVMHTPSFALEDRTCTSSLPWSAALLAVTATRENSDVYQRQKHSQIVRIYGGVCWFSIYFLTKLEFILANQDTTEITTPMHHLHSIRCTCKHKCIRMTCKI